MINAKQARELTREAGLEGVRQIKEIISACFISIEQDARKGCSITNVCVHGCLASSIEVALDGLKNQGFHCELQGKFKDSIYICWLDDRDDT